MTKQYCKKDESGKVTEIFHEPLLLGNEQIYNPSDELMLSLGWVEYIPEPQPKTNPTTEERLAAVESVLSVQTIAYGLTDDKALEVMALFPAWADHIGETAEVGFRTYYDSGLYRCVQQHTIHSDWQPDKTPALWVKISIEEWPEWVQPTGATEAYAKGAKVTHNGSHWISIVDGNVWEPSSDVPNLWQLVQVQ